MIISQNHYLNKIFDVLPLPKHRCRVWMLFQGPPVGGALLGMGLATCLTGAPSLVSREEEMEGEGEVERLALAIWEMSKQKQIF